MSQFGGKDLKRHFTVVMGGKEHGLYVSSTPSSAAKKAVTKLCAANKSKKVEFHIREITQGSKKKTYGPYSGHIEKLKEPIKLEGRVIKYKPVAKIAGKRSEMKGGVSEFNKSANSVSGLTVGAIEKMFKNFKVEDQQNPAPFHYKRRLRPTNTLYFGVMYLLYINDEKYYPFSIHFIKDEAHIRYLMSLDEYNLNKYDFLNINEYKLYINNYAFKDYRIIEFKIKVIQSLINIFFKILQELSNSSDKFLENKNKNFNDYLSRLLFIDFLIKFISSLNFLTPTYSNDSIKQIQQKLNINFDLLKYKYNTFIEIINPNSMYMPNIPPNHLYSRHIIPNVSHNLYSRPIVDANEKMFKNFKVEAQQNPALFHYEIRHHPINTLYFGKDYLLEINGQKYYPFSIHFFINDDAHIRYLTSDNVYNEFTTNFLIDSDYKLYQNYAFNSYKIFEFNEKVMNTIIRYLSKYFYRFSHYKSIDELSKENYYGHILFKKFLENFISSLNFLTNKYSNDSINKLKEEINNNFNELYHSFRIFEITMSQLLYNKYIQKKPTQILPNIPENLLKPNIKLPNINLLKFPNN